MEKQHFNELQVDVKHYQGVSRSTHNYYDFYGYRTKIDDQWFDLIVSSEVKNRVPKTDGVFSFYNVEIRVVDPDEEYPKAYLNSIGDYEFIKPHIKRESIF